MTSSVHPATTNAIQSDRRTIASGDGDFSDMPKTAKPTPATNCKRGSITRAANIEVRAPAKKTLITESSGMEALWGEKFEIKLDLVG